MRSEKTRAVPMPALVFPRCFFSLLAPLPSLLSHRCFPIASVKMLDFKFGQIHAFNTSQVHVNLIRVGARDIKRRHTASRAEMMFGSVGVEGICGEVFPRRQQAEPFTRDYPVDVRFFGADRAVALRHPAVDRPDNFVSDAPAMASAAVNWAVLELIRHEHESGANWQRRQMRRIPAGPSLRYKIEDTSGGGCGQSGEPQPW